MAGTIIDALVVTLGLDSTKFKQGQKDSGDSLKKFREQTESDAKKISQQAAVMAQGFKSIRNELIALFSVALAGKGLKEFVADTTTSQASLGRFATNLNMSSREMAGWIGVVKSVGGTADDAKGAFSALAQGMAEFRNTGQSAYLAQLNNMGISTVANGRLRAAGDIMRDIAKYERSVSAQDALFAGARLGQSANFVNAARLPDLEAMIERFAKLSRMTDESAKSAEYLQRQWALLEARTEGFRNVLYEKLSPVLNQIINQFGAWLDANSEQIAQGISDAVGNLVKWFQSVDWKALGEEIRSVVDQLGGMKGVLLILAGLTFAGPIAGVLSLAAAVLKLGGIALGLGTTGALGVLGGLGLAGIAAAGGIAVAKPLGKALGLPDVDRNTGIDDLSKDNWMDASKHLPAGDFIKAASLRVLGKSSGEIADILRADVAADVAKGATGTKSGSGRFDAIDAKNGLPIGTLNKVYQAESSGGKNLYSKAGALGPFQFMPGTAAELGLHGTDVFDTDKSAEAAGRYLKSLLKMFNGDMPSALAAYNWGAGHVQRLGLANAPGETQRYLDKILGPGSYGAAANSQLASSGPRSTVSSETRIENINISTQATDAPGIARSIGPELNRYGFTVNTGVT